MSKSRRKSTLPDQKGKVLLGVRLEQLLSWHAQDRWSQFWGRLTFWPVYGFHLMWLLAHAGN
jgi:hypothetical protein